MQKNNSCATERAKTAVFTHHIYEYEKGVRKLILHTMKNEFLFKVRKKLTEKNIAFLIRELDNGTFNVFFGDDLCVKLVEGFGDKKLNQFTDQEDFILGVLLGYGLEQQCTRYLKRKDKEDVGVIVG